MNTDIGVQGDVVVYVSNDALIKTAVTVIGLIIIYFFIKQMAD